MAVDKRTYVIVMIIIAIALPTIILTFRKSFFPIIASIGSSLTSAALTNGSTGVPEQIMEFFK